MGDKRIFQHQARWVAVAALCLLGSWPLSARAQSCPGGFSACDNGGCCLSSDQCCPTLAEGCCGPHTPYCCGDGSCAASPSECGNLARNTCTDYDVPCGEGCAPAGSQCCDLVGHYCPPQGICTSETTCAAGDRDSEAVLVIASAAPPPEAVPVRQISPLRDPPDGSARSCQLTRRPAAPHVSALSWGLLAAGAWLRRRRGGGR